MSKGLDSSLLNDFLIGAAEIKVSPEQMAAKANSVSIKISRIRQKFVSLEQSVKRTSSYWKGEANDTYRDWYGEFKPETEELIKRMEEHVRDLQKMSGIYQKAEDQAETISEGLPADIIL